MRKNSRKGFTIVELVIVIAVIAILAAVLIPTFSGIIDKANTSADIQLIREANMLIQAEMIDLDRSLTKEEAYTVLKDNGIDITKVTGANNSFIFLPSEQKFIIYDTEQKSVVFPEDTAESLATWSPNFTIRYHDGLNLIYTKDSNGNKIYGLVDQEEIATGEMKYSIKEGVLTVTATGNDGYGVTSLMVDVVKDSRYTFYCNVKKENSNEPVGWSNNNGDGKVMTALGYDVWIFGTGWSFKSDKTVPYSMRFDVNKTGDTAWFSEIRVVEGNEKVSGYMSNTSLAYGETENLAANSFTREGYIFDCWNTERDGSGIAIKNGADLKELIESGIEFGNVTLYAQWKSK